jgi:hypothetical protein
MKTRCVLLLASLLVMYGFIQAQPASGTVTITAGSKWSDALLRKSNLSSESSFATTNYNSWQRISATAWTHSSQVILYRNLLRFDLSEIPINSTVCLYKHG